MTTLKRGLLALIGSIALAGALVPAHADTVPEVEVSATRVSCEASSPRDARALARDAEKAGEHQRAAECFLAAGDNLRAHRAMVRAAADTNAAAKQKAAVAAETAKGQLQRVKAAFR